MQEGVLERSLYNLLYKRFPFVICRLGARWKALPQTEKESYFEKARKAEAEHMAKYPCK
jgi:hypothetical protein